MNWTDLRRILRRGLKAEPVAKAPPYTVATSVPLENVTVTIPEIAKERTMRAWPKWMQERNEIIARNFRKHRAGPKPALAVKKCAQDQGLTEAQIRNILKRMGVWDR